MWLILLSSAFFQEKSKKLFMLNSDSRFDLISFNIHFIFFVEKTANYTVVYIVQHSS